MFHLDDQVVIDNDGDTLYGTVYAILGNGIYSVVLDSGDVQEFWEDELS